MIVSLVVAASENNVIGRDNRLLWRLPNDMTFFKNVTWGMPVIMGRKTYESLGKPLKGRTNIIITRNADFGKEDIVVVSSLDEAISVAAATDAKECYIIGGGEIYKQSIEIANKVYMTRVLTVIEGDTYFPVIDRNEWKLSNVKSFEADDKHAYAYRFETWERL
ncbi:MAG: dihydrofolate reductase [Chitinophagaceae bacterium]|nr:dihydrofolate reductase [Chitinophagaceae bacterium]